MKKEQLYEYRWGNNPKRATMKGRKCRVLARGKKNTALVEFENGQRETVSRNALRKVQRRSTRNMLCKCPECGYSIDIATVLPAIEEARKAMARFGYGEPDVQCPNCQEYFAYKPAQEHAKDET